MTLHCAHCAQAITPPTTRRVLWSVTVRAWLILCQACARTLRQKED